MKIETWEGPNVLVGDVLEKRRHITLEDPWKNRWETMSGEKHEYGEGGFEFLVPSRGVTHQLTVDNIRFDVPIPQEGCVTHLTFTEAELDPASVPPAQPPEPEPEPQPKPKPKPEPEPEPEPEPIPQPTQDQLRELLAGLDKLLTLLEARYEGG